MERVNGQKDYSLVVEDFLATLPSSGIMAAEDAQKIHHICMGHYSAPTELRLRFPMNGEQYSWYRIRHGAVKRDASGRMIQILGILRNIDQSKRESDHLRALSEQDTFTGLLNKHSTNDAISQYLKEYGGEKKHALLMMDLDHFKGINDTMVINSAIRYCWSSARFCGGFFIPPILWGGLAEMNFLYL